MGCEQSRPTGPGPVIQQKEVERPLEAKIVLLGDSGVGKSSLALRYCQGRFSPYHEVTIGAAFLQQMIRLSDGTQLKLHLWDTGGQERFRAMAPLYYRDALGALIVYDCTDNNSFESVKYWSQELRAKGPENACLAVVANKCDQMNDQTSDKDAGKGNPVDQEEAKKWCLENDMLFAAASAKTGEGVNAAFAILANRIYQEIIKPRKEGKS